MVNPFENAEEHDRTHEEEHDRINQAVRTFAEAIGCDMSSEGGKEFARILMVALAEAAFEGGDIFDGLARKLVTLRRRR